MQATKRAARLAVFVGALIAIGPTAYAQQPSAAAMASAKELVALTGVTQLFNPLIPGVVEQAKLLFLQQNPTIGKPLNEIAEKVRANLAPRFSEVTDEVARLYATTFSEQELQAILAFYRTPAGKKFLERQPKVAEASVRFAQQWSNKLTDEAIAQIRTELKKRGIAE